MSVWQRFLSEVEESRGEWSWYVWGLGDVRGLTDVFFACHFEGMAFDVVDRDFFPR